MSSSVIKKRKIGARVLLAVAPWCAARLIRILFALMKVDFVGEQAVLDTWRNGVRTILVAWHEQLLMMAMGYHGPGVKLLISRSSDGELLAKTMSFFGYGAVRGSSSRGGKAAFREMLALAKEPFDLALTPDGPRGPRRELKDGVVQLARLSGRPVIPVAFVCSRGHRFNSWDRFLVPYPFSRGVFSYGQPVYFDSASGVEEFRHRLIEEIAATQRRAEERLESYGLSSV